MKNYYDIQKIDLYKFLFLLISSAFWLFMITFFYKIKSDISMLYCKILLVVAISKIIAAFFLLSRKRFEKSLDLAKKEKEE